MYLLAAMLLVSCTSDIEAPKTKEKYQRVNIEACRNVGLDLNKLTEPMVKNFLECLNGNNDSILAYKNLIDDLSSEELEAFLSIYNTHMLNDSRIKKALDLFEQMLISGQLDEFFGSFSRLIDSGVVQRALPLFKVLYSTDSGQADPAIDYFNEFLVDLINRGLFTDSVFSFTQFVDSGRARLMARMIPLASGLADYNSDKIVDNIATAMDRSISSGGFHEMATILYDPMNYMVFKEILQNTNGSTAGVNSYFEYLAFKSFEQGFINDLIVLTQLTNRPATCFAGSGNGRQVDNLFDLSVQEISIRNSDSDLVDMYLKEIPFHIRNLEKQCDIDPKVKMHYANFVQAVKDGYVNHISSLQLAFYENHRTEYIKRLLSSPELNTLLPLIGHSSDQNIFGYFLDLLTKDLDPSDYQVFSTLGLLMSVEDLPPAKTKDWIHRNMKDDLARQQLVDLVEESQLSFIELTKYLDRKSFNQPTASQLSAKLRLSIADRDFSSSPSSKFLPVVQKLFSNRPENRQRLKDFVSSILDLWQKDPDAFGDFFVVLSETMSISKDNPVQEFVRDLLSDKSFTKAINPILFKLIENNKLYDALELTSQLAKDGELSRMMSLIIDLGRGMDLEPLSTDRYPIQYVRFAGKPDDFFNSYAFQPTPVPDSYVSCDALLSKPDKWNSEYIKFLAQCISSEEPTQFKEIVELLEKIALEDGSSYNLLDYIAYLAQEKLLASEDFFPALEGLHEIYDSGNYSKAMQLLVGLTQSDAFIPIENTVKLACSSSSKVSWAPLLLSTLNMPNSAQAVSSAYKLMSSKADLYYEGFQTKHLKIASEDRQKLWAQLHQVKKDLKPEFKEDLSAYFLKMERDYGAKNESYKYDQGVYEFPGESDDEKVDYYEKLTLRLLNYATRGDSVHALVQAMNSLNEMDYDWEAFFKYTLEGSPRLIRYWSDKDDDYSARIISPLESAEILVQNSRLSVAKWAAGIGAKHIGTLFQHELATSTDRKDTLKGLKSKVKLGLFYTGLTSNERKRNRLRNIKENFNILEELEQQGLLVFFSEIYRHLYEITPKSKRKQDPEVSYVSIVHEPMRFGIFSFLDYFYKNLKRQGLESDFFSILRSFPAHFSKRDADSVKASAQWLIEENERSGIIRKLARIALSTEWPRDDERFIHYFFAVAKLMPSASGLEPLLKELLPEAAINPEFFNLVKELVFDGEYALDLANNTLHMDRDRLELIRLWTRELSFEKESLASLAKLLVEIHKKSPENTRLLLSELYNYFSENQSDLIDFQETLEEIISSLDPSGINILKDLLEDSNFESTTGKMMCGLAKEGKFESVILLLDELGRSRELDKIFDMIDRHFN
ncbi:MAG: hypothetical protein AB8E15_13680 [Bdellovibrionales bacterium]